ncbi:MAG: HD-GYP domain-containing protein [Fimbriimonadales bacterium]
MARRTGGWALAMAPRRLGVVSPGTRRGIWIGFAVLLAVGAVSAAAPIVIAVLAWGCAGLLCAVPWSQRFAVGPARAVLSTGAAFGAGLALVWPYSPWLLGLVAISVCAVGWSLEALRRRGSLDDRLFEDLGALLSAAHPYTHGHSRRVAELSVRIGRRMGLRGSELRLLRRAALLHDLGKLALTRRVLDKPSVLSEAEFREIRQHPVVGSRVAEAAHPFRSVAAVVRHHHERLDGNGYPEGLRGDQVPLACRILAVADAFDAMTGGSGGSERSYRSALGREEALGELRRNAGSQFDERVVKALVEVLDELD